MYSSSVVVFYCGLVLIGLPIYPHGYCTGTWANHVYSAGLLHMNLPRNDITAKKQRQNKLSAYESGHEGVARAMRAHANAFLMRHASIRIRYLGVFRVRYARICAHSHAMRVHSHRMRSHSHRMRSHRMRMRAFKGNLCVSGTVILIESVLGDTVSMNILSMQTQISFHF